uniref:Uncharacterized protein n=1 Tax=Anguilla anguilla TaxID=7936 RepID=A0A0E9UK97_ANGAN
MCGYRVLPAGLPVPFIDLLSIGPRNLHIDVQETSFGNLKPSGPS